MWCLTVKCHLCQWLVYSNQSSCSLPSSNKWQILPYICAKMMVWKIIFFFFSHPGDSVTLVGVRESGSISGRLPDPGGFTCKVFSNSDQNLHLSRTTSKGTVLVKALVFGYNGRHLFIKMAGSVTINPCYKYKIGPCFKSHCFKVHKTGWPNKT